MVPAERPDRLQLKIPADWGWEGEVGEELKAQADGLLPPLVVPQ